MASVEDTTADRDESEPITNPDRQERHDRNERREHHVVANVTVAHELAGWCWSLATLE
ncbi:hypothetical protein [Mycobacterium sp. 1164985.4]|uniref:hypothetical protein n=1 Tax=Mycobacterium sp. 1164985.4 TaxID=1834069 RepID=UPI000A774136|nr:hypothetical protein [Mycobacterium sp. 1164985.4]